MFAFSHSAIAMSPFQTLLLYVKTGDLNLGWLLWAWVQCCSQVRCSDDVMLFLGPELVCLCGTALRCVDVLVSSYVWLEDLQHTSALHGVGMPVFAKH